MVSKGELKLLEVYDEKSLLKLELDEVLLCLVRAS